MTKSIYFFEGNESKVGETAVVTGGSRGVGASLVKTLLQANMHVIIGKLLFGSVWHSSF